MRPEAEALMWALVLLFVTLACLSADDWPRGRYA